jgi:hypothetical protein
MRSVTDVPRSITLMLFMIFSILGCAPSAIPDPPQVPLVSEESHHVKAVTERSAVDVAIWRQTLPPLVDTKGLSPIECEVEVLALPKWPQSISSPKTIPHSQILKRVRASPSASRDLIDLLNDPSVYQREEYMCLCPFGGFGLSVHCGNGSTEFLADPACGWVAPSSVADSHRHLNALGRWSLVAFQNDMLAGDSRGLELRRK